MEFTLHQFEKEVVGWWVRIEMGSGYIVRRIYRYIK